MFISIQSVVYIERRERALRRGQVCTPRYKQLPIRPKYHSRVQTDMAVVILQDT